MVADRLGVGRTDADIDQRHAVALVGHQVIGRHLVAAPRPGGDRRFGIVEIAAFEQAARDRKARERAVGSAQRIDREADEFVDVADVIGEQDEVLEIFRRGARIMFQPGQTEVGAGTVEQGEGAALGIGEIIFAVGYLVADMRQLGRRKPA